MSKQAMFINKLLALFAEFDIRFDSLDNYDGEENYQGTEYWFHGSEEILLSMRELESLARQHREQAAIENGLGY